MNRADVRAPRRRANPGRAGAVDAGGGYRHDPAEVDAKADAAHFGRYGEAMAARWYRRAGYQVLARNWRCPEGELDLVVARGTDLAVVEVKARASDRFGGGAAAVDHRKRRRLRTSAIRWLDQSDRRFGEIRFDVVEVDRSGRVEVHEGCF